MNEFHEQPEKIIWLFSEMKWLSNDFTNNWKKRNFALTEMFIVQRTLLKWMNFTNNRKKNKFCTYRNEMNVPRPLLKWRMHFTKNRGNYFSLTDITFAARSFSISFIIWVFANLIVVLCLRQSERIPWMTLCMVLQD